MADLQFTVSALDRTAATLLKVAAQLDKVGDRLDKLDGKVAKITVALDDKTKAGLDNVERKVKNLDGKKATIKVDVDRSLSDSLVKVALLGRALQSLALPAAAIAAAPQIAALGSAAVTAVGAIGVLPGILGAAGLAAGTASTAFGGLIKFFTADSAKKQGEAYATLTDSGKKLADTIKGLTPQFKSLHDAVQNAALQGFVNQVKPLAASYIPMLRTEMVKVAEGFNVAGLSLAKFFQQKNTVADLQGAFMSMRIAVNNTIVALKPMAQAFTDIFVTSTARLPSLTKGIGEAAAHFAAFIKTARETGQLGEWIDKGVAAVKLLGQIVGNVGSMILSVFRAASAEGATLFQTLAAVTGKMADFLKSAKGQAALVAVFGAIREAVGAITPVVEALLPLLSTALVAAGTSLVKVFQALGPPLRDIATALANSLAPVLPGIADAFGRIALALVPMISQTAVLTPAFDALAKAGLAVAQFFASFFTGAATTTVAIFKALVPLITLAVQGLTVLLHIIEPIAPAMGAMVAAFAAFKLASAGIAGVQGILTGVGKSIAEAALNAGVFTEKVTGSATAGEKLALAGGKLQSGLGALGVALPIIAIAAAGAALAYDQMRDKSDELTASVMAGQQSMGAAIAEQSNRIQEQSMVMQEASGQTEAMGQGIGELTGQLDANSNVVDATAQATAQLNAKHEEMISRLPVLEQLQIRVTDAENAFKDAVRQFGENSSQAIAAHDALVVAKGNLKRANDDAATAEKSLADQIVATTAAAAGAANADLGYQQSLLTLKDAQDRAAEAAANHSTKASDLTKANLAVQQASLSAAAAAQTKAEADAKAAGASDVAQIGAQAYKDELLRQAATMEGPNKQALINLANRNNTAAQAHSTAEIRARAQKDELQLLADKENGPLKAAIEGTIAQLGNAGGAHATAQQKADAQRAMLQSLADQANGPTKDAILGMIANLGSIPKETTFTVKGVGQVSYGSPELLRAAHGGYTGGIIGMNRAGLTGVAYADGGITPGYTPGRDVHRFQSATGGTLDLSGGEAIMRPEWTQAVGPDYVRSANAAARSGGARGVRRYMGYAAGGIIPSQAFAEGGMVLTGTPFRQIPSQLFNTVAGSLVGTIRSAIESAINALIAQVKAAAAALAASVGGMFGGGGSVTAGGARGWIIAHESGGNPRAQNPTSSASGLYQFIDGTWRSLGGSTAHAKDASVAEQNAIADRYVSSRYGGWDGAVAFWQCLTLDSMILTRRGWLTHEDVQVGDLTIGYNAETERSEWTKVTAVHHYDSAPVVELRSNNWHARATANHRWVSRHWVQHGRGIPAETVDGFVSTEKITSRHALRLAAPADTGLGPAISTDEAALLGWVLGDGTVTYTGGRWQVRIYQTKPHYVEVIEALLKDVPHSHYTVERRVNVEHQWYLRLPYARELLARAGYDHFDPVPFVLSLSPAQRMAFLKAVEQAEGGEYVTRKASGRFTECKLRRLSQADGPKQDAIVLAGYLEGYRVSLSRRKRYQAHHQEAAVITLARPWAGGQSLTRTELGEAPVWCVTTDLGSFTTEQDGQVFLTGNSHGWYDRGGYLSPGVTMAMNNTGARERVLDPAQTRDWDQGRGRGNDALLTELRQLNGTTRMLRGDVDQSGNFGALIAEVHALRTQLASVGPSVVGEAQGARTVSVLGAF